MYRTALKSVPSAARAVRPTSLASTSRRFLSTSPAAKRRTWKGAGLRWGLAIAAVYFYNTSPIFADELPPQTGSAPVPFSDSDLPTVDALIEEKRRQTAIAAPPPPPPQEASEATEAESSPIAIPEHGSPEELEQEAGQEGAFNPETGEINWDCPCLGGMAHGPCGEEFKAAFSCFVFSTEEPKGMDCIDKFQHMQDCFRIYPEIYGSEIAEDEEDEASAPVPDAALAKDASESPVYSQDTTALPESAPAPETPSATPTDAGETGLIQKLSEDVKLNAEDAGPKQAHDATDANKGKEQ